MWNFVRMCRCCNSFSCLNVKDLSLSTEQIWIKFDTLQLAFYTRISFIYDFSFLLVTFYFYVRKGAGKTWWYHKHIFTVQTDWWTLSSSRGELLNFLCLNILPMNFKLYSISVLLVVRLVAKIHSSIHKFCTRHRFLKKACFRG